MARRAGNTVYPPVTDVFNALHFTPYQSVRAVILGQDPYFGEGEAHGLAFSVPDGVDVPPSLVNMYKELQNELGIPPKKSGNLIGWAKQGVLLLNTVLTVRAHQANSHKGRGWEQFTDSIIKKISLPSIIRMTDAVRNFNERINSNGNITLITTVFCADLKQALFK